MNIQIINIPRPDKIKLIHEYIDVWINVRNILKDSIKKIPDTLFIKPMEDKTWSASQIVEHLALTQDRFSRSIPLIFKGRLKSSTIENMKENYVFPDYDYIENYFRKHKKVKNPEGVTPIQILKKTEALNHLENSMTLFKKNISDKNIDELKNIIFEHPVLGYTSLLDTVWTQILHEEHHLFYLHQKYFSEEKTEN
ncbi:MAG: DinB family protein [Spirochaetia bacterium]|nr:DinB family protein [Spirochaetia bacterium]